MSRHGGYSLLELLLVLVIASILVGIALPAYRGVAVRAHRVVGKAALMEVLDRQERYLLHHKRYSSNLESLGFNEEYYVGPAATVVRGEEALYRIELTLNEGQFSGARAVPLNAQLRDSQCGTFTLDRWGQQGVLGAHSRRPDRCW